MSRRVKYTPISQQDEEDMFNMKTWDGENFNEPDTVHFERETSFGGEPSSVNVGEEIDTSFGGGDQTFVRRRTNARQPTTQGSTSRGPAVRPRPRTRAGGGPGRRRKGTAALVGKGLVKAAKFLWKHKTKIGAAGLGAGAVAGGYYASTKPNTSPYLSVEEHSNVRKKIHANQKEVRNKDPYWAKQDNLAAIKKHKDENDALAQGLQDYHKDPPLTLPDHHFLGPGNTLTDKDPYDEDDAIAKEHDTAYATAKTYNDIDTADKDAVDKFWADAQGRGNWHSAVAGLGLYAKNKFESIYGIQYPHGIGESAKKRQRENETTPVKKTKPVAEDPVRELGEGESMPVIPNTDTGATAPGGGSAAPAVANDGGGSSPGGGIDDGPVWEGEHHTPNYSTRTYKKTYRFFMNNDAASVAKQAADDVTIFYPGSFHAIPYEYVWFYMSNGEIEECVRSYEEVRITNSAFQISTFGVRLPFYTNATNTTIANAGAQYPIGVWEGFDKHFPTILEDTSLQTLQGHCWGEPLNAGTLNEVSAQLQPRKFHNPCGLIMRTSQYGGEPNIYPYGKLWNGSTQYGPFYSKQYKPKNNIFHAYENPLTYNGTANRSQLLRGSNYVRDVSSGQAGKELNMRTADVIISGTPPTIASIHDEAIVTHYRNQRAWYRALLENNCAWDARDPMRQSHSMPRVCIGFLDLQNSDGTALDVHWEFIIETTIELRCKNGQPGIIKRKEVSTAPWEMRFPNYMFSNMTSGHVVFTSSGPSTEFDRESWGLRRGINNQDPLEYTQNQQELPMGDKRRTRSVTKRIAEMERQEAEAAAEEKAEKSKKRAPLITLSK